MSNTPHGLPGILPVHPLTDLVAFPFMIFSLFVKDTQLAAFQQSLRNDSLILLVKFKEGMENIRPVRLHEVGTVCRISRLIMLEDGAKVMLEGLSRARLLDVQEDEGHLEGHIDAVEEPYEKNMVTEA